MPIYEYECSNCKDMFEITQKITEDPLSVCQKCGGELRKLISSASFVLKGSGWYVTDYPSEHRRQALTKENKNGNDKAHTTEKQETKSETVKSDTSSDTSSKSESSDNSKKEPTAAA
ncbi:regulatory protein, FmdB family [Candidatus Magnetoovum chiemensis]|nr:regulatory protein, FmdB family [Candidatus Magnetoovum chiemensis]